jgi:hypothetical protein
MRFQWRVRFELGRLGQRACPAFCKEDLVQVTFKVEIIKAAADRSGQ